VHSLHYKLEVFEMKPALVIIDMQHWFFRSEERRVKLPELITAINDLIDAAKEKSIHTGNILLCILWNF